MAAIGEPATQPAESCSAPDPVPTDVAGVRVDPPGADAGAETGAGVAWKAIWIGMVALAGASAVAMHLWARNVPGTGFLPLLTLLVCLLAAGFDAATRRIPNAITYTAVVMGLSLNVVGTVVLRLAGPNPAAVLGAAGIGQATLGLAACLGIGLVCLLLSGMGGGDVKLITAIGTLLGYAAAMDVLLWALAIAVVYSLLNLIIRGRLNSVLRAAALQVLQIVCFRRFEPVEVDIEARSCRTIPLAVPLALGLFCARLVPREVVLSWLGGV